jgi:hypothetical protein
MVEKLLASQDELGCMELATQLLVSFHRLLIFFVFLSSFLCYYLSLWLTFSRQKRCIISYILCTYMWPVGHILTVRDTYIHSN